MDVSKWTVRTICLPGSVLTNLFGADGSVGIWHGTYLVDSKKYECIYGNISWFGLAQAANYVEVIGNRETARLWIERA